MAPGIVFELLRERKRAGRPESAFREAARMALGSLGFTLTASLLLIGVNAIFGNRILVNLNGLVADPAAYAKQHVVLILVTVVAELVVACALAVVLDIVLGKRGEETTSVRQQSAWRQAFREDRPKNSVAWLHVQLTDGSAFVGYLRSHTTMPGDPAERELILEGAGMVYIGTEAAGPKEIGDKWSRVVIPGSQIKCVWVQYRDLATGNRVDAKQRPMIHSTTSV